MKLGKFDRQKQAYIIGHNALLFLIDGILTFIAADNERLQKPLLILVLGIFAIQIGSMVYYLIRYLKKPLSEIEEEWKDED
jgi:glucose uptake protein GlcU